MRAIRLFCAVLFAGMLISAIVPAASGASPSRPFAGYGHPSLEAIDAAYQAGEIDRSEALLYRAYFIFSPDQLPERFALPGPAIKDATGILLEIQEELDGLPSDIQGKIQRLLVRPTLPDQLQTAHFIVHYDAGMHAQAYVENVAQACEDAWTKYHTDLGWDVPPSDGAIGGGLGMIDCYIHALSSGILGMAQTESPAPGGAPNDYTGYFHVSEAIGDQELRMVTVAHEYMHIVQYGHVRSGEITWWMENCAMRGEEWVYDTYNEYLPYMPPFFQTRYNWIETYDGTYEYSQIAWPMYFCERFDPDAVRAIWYEQKWSPTGSFWAACNEVLAPYGYDGNEAYLEFMRWCYYTGSRDDGNHFEEGSTWATLPTDRTVLAYPSGEKHPRTDRRPEGMGASVNQFRPEDSDNILQVIVDGPNTTLGSDLIQSFPSGMCIEYSMSIDETGYGVIEIPMFDECTNVIMLTSMGRGVGETGQDFAFWADCRSDASGVAELRSGEKIRIHPNYPNPFRLTTAIGYSLEAAADVTVRILDLNGRVVRHLYAAGQRPGNYEITWNRADDAGRLVGGGVYFAVLTVGGEERTRQMTVLP